jgi:hypothetical protein
MVFFGYFFQMVVHFTEGNKTIEDEKKSIRSFTGASALMPVGSSSTSHFAFFYNVVFWWRAKFIKPFYRQTWKVCFFYYKNKPIKD